MLSLTKNLDNSRTVCECVRVQSTATQAHRRIAWCGHGRFILSLHEMKCNTRSTRVQMLPCVDQRDSVITAKCMASGL